MMTIVLSLLAQILHTGLMVVAAPTVAGALDWLDARLTGRRGPPILLPWRDLVRLSRKTPAIVESVSVVSRVAPALGLGATLSAAALVPSFTLGMAFAPLADVLVIVSLLTVARLAAGLAALDAGAALPGLAAQNASARAVLAEPALMLAVVTLALIGGSFNLDLIIGQQREGLLLPAAASAVALIAMLALLFAEASIAPSEADPILSGTDLAISRMTCWLRRLVWIDLIGGLFLPVGMAAAADNGLLAWLIGLGFWAVKLAAFILGLSAIQTGLGRVPRHSLPDLIGVAALLALLATIMVLASAGTA
jgi:formate hydrogenlyase subunit 4